MLTIAVIILISVFAGYIFVRLFQLPRSNNAMRNFHLNELPPLIQDMPQAVSQTLTDENNLSCRFGSLKLAAGGEVPFYWWEWHVSRQMISAANHYLSTKSFLAVSFPANTVSEEFENQVSRSVQKDEMTQNFVNALVVDWQTPIRAEKLADGSFLICWQVSERVKVLRETLNWLRNNVAAREPALREN